MYIIKIYKITADDEEGQINMKYYHKSHLMLENIINHILNIKYYNE